MSIFKKGDKVFDIRFGWGEVTDDEYGGTYPLKVHFENGRETYTYTYNGIINTVENIPLLSLKEYSLEGFSQERPLPKINKGDLVYVKTVDMSHWLMRFFSHYGGDGSIYVFVGQKKEGNVIQVEELSIENPFKEYEVK